MEESLGKVFIIGSNKAKKTAFLLRAVDPNFSESYMTTIGVDFKIYQTTICGRQIKMQIRDTAGSEKFMRITRSFFYGANAIIFLYKTTSRETYDEIIRYISDTRQCITDPKILLYVVAFTKSQNKEPQVQPDEGRKTASQFNATFLEATFSDQNSCQGVFDKIGLDLVQQIPGSDENGKESKMKLKFKSNQKPVQKQENINNHLDNNEENNPDGRKEVCFIQ